MGETVNLRNRRSGGSSLNDYLDQGDNEASVGRMLKVILPTMDLKDFRRRFRIDTFSQNIPLGSRIQDLRWTVPRGEAWRPRALLYENTDSVTHEVVAKLTLARGADSRGLAFMEIGQTRIPNASNKILWPLVVEQQPGDSLWQSDLDFVLEPADSITLEDFTVSVDASPAMGAQLYYELVPEPTETRSQGVAAAVTVV